jgi:hypothetical protein
LCDDGGMASLRTWNGRSQSGRRGGELLAEFADFVGLLGDALLGELR